jgi:hypothetical protein
MVVLYHRAGAAKRRRQISQARSVLGTDEPVADGSRRVRPSCRF